MGRTWKVCEPMALPPLLTLSVTSREFGTSVTSPSLAPCSTAAPEAEKPGLYCAPSAGTDTFSLLPHLKYSACTEAD